MAPRLAAAKTTDAIAEKIRAATNIVMRTASIGEKNPAERADVLLTNSSNTASLSERRPRRRARESTGATQVAVAAVRKYSLSHAVASTADTDSSLDKYVISLYWVFTTMTTVGYGDVIPTNNMERVFAVCVILFGATVFGYIISTIAEMSNEHNRDALGLNMSLLRHYGTEQHFSERMHKLMRFHYGFWYQEMTPRQEESRLLAKLPPALRKEVIKYIHRHVISSIPLFRKQLPDWFVAAAVRLLEPQAFCAGEVIVSEFQAGPRQDVFFVHGGHCESYCTSSASHRASHRPGTVRRRGSALMKAEGPCVCGAGCEGECPGRLLDVYPPGSAFGYEFILQESSFSPFIDHKKMMVRCSQAAPCFLYALRHCTLTDINRNYPEFGQVVQEAAPGAAAAGASRRGKLGVGGPDLVGHLWQLRDATRS
ncbi:unnamed protein product [Prorocentrum cordatum]|uniref:Potassium channel domain-containing protein n=1 Tax=Prorocentrum cordatum TaxID=2364126 RepID=A0ABN9TNT7_9DINO|nr:unnamed protein product [Polarella glacialis]